MRLRRSFITIHDLSRRMGLPKTYLLREANAGRLPCIRTGRRLMFHLESTERLLREHAEQRAGQELSA